MEILVCIGSACHLKGSYEVIKRIQDYLEARGLEEGVSLKSSFCLGHCSTAVSIMVQHMGSLAPGGSEDKMYYSVTPDTVVQVLETTFGGA